MKTAEEILKESFEKNIVKKYGDSVTFKDASYNGGYDWIYAAMSDFAAQSVREDRESMWISVEKELPPKRETVLVHGPMFNRCWGHYESTNKFGNMFWAHDQHTYNITHWMRIDPPINL